MPLVPIKRPLVRLSSHDFVRETSSLGWPTGWLARLLVLGSSKREGLEDAAATSTARV